MSYKLGGNARLYYGGTSTRSAWPGTGAAGGLSILRHVGDLKLNLDREKVDATTRDTPGFDTYFGGLVDANVSFQIKYDPSDAGYQALESNFFATNGATLQIACLDGDSATTGTKGLWMDAQVFKFEKGEPVKGLQTIDVEIAPALASGTSALGPSWVTVG